MRQILAKLSVLLWKYGKSSGTKSELCHFQPALQFNYATMSIVEEYLLEIVFAFRFCYS